MTPPDAALREKAKQIVSWHPSISLEVARNLVSEIESALLAERQAAQQAERVKWKALQKRCCFAGVGQACPIHESK